MHERMDAYTRSGRKEEVRKDKGNKDKKGGREGRRMGGKKGGREEGREEGRK